MMSPEEREQGTITDEEAEARGVAWGWDRIFESAEEGHLKDFKKGDKGIQSFGVGIHALQDASAHHGTDHGGHSLTNDVAGNLNQAKALTASAATVHKLLSGDWKGIKTNKKGKLSIDISGMSGEQKMKIIEAASAYLKSQNNEDEK